MKRLIALVLVGAMSLALFGCGKKDTGRNKDRDEDDSPKATAEDVVEDNNEDAGVKVSKKNGEIVFAVDPGFALTEYAWLGFCPGTKGYTNEADADAAQALYSYIVNDGGHQDGDEYIFSVSEDQIGGLDDGKYVIVLCDDDNDGKVILYIPAEIEGTKLTCDFDNIVIN